MSQGKVQVTTVPGGLKALASRDSQPNVMVVYVDKLVNENLDVHNNIIAEDNSIKILHNDRINREQSNSSHHSQEITKRSEDQIVQESLLNLSPTDESSSNSDDDEESSENEERLPNVVGEQLQLHLKENSSNFDRDGKVKRSVEEEYGNGDLISQTININEVGPDVTTPREHGFSVSSVSSLDSNMRNEINYEESNEEEEVEDVFDDQLKKIKTNVMFDTSMTSKALVPGKDNIVNKNRLQKSKSKRPNNKQKQSQKNNSKSKHGDKSYRRKRKTKGKNKKRSKRNQRPAVLTPEEFNDLYGLGDKIGSGAYGIVYRGLDKTNGAFLAVKEIYCGQDVVGGMTDVVTEVQILQRLRHPNIVRYVGAAVLWDRLYIFTEWVSGGSLTQILAQFGQLPVGLVAQHTLQILKGLAYLHNQGIVHRDIKGQNILVSKDGRIKLADFGAARLLKNITKGPALFGTPAFLAPEVITNERCDIKADIWSLGCTIIQMLSGETPWAVRGFKSVYELLHHVSTSNDSPPLDHVPERETTEDMIDFLNQCFRRNPDERPNTKSLFSHPFVCTKQESNRKVSDSNNQTKRKKKALKTQDSFDDSFNRSGALKIATAFFRKAKGGNPTTPLQSPEKVMEPKANFMEGKKKGWRLVPTSSEIHFRDAADRRVAYEKRSPTMKDKNKKKVGVVRDTNVTNDGELVKSIAKRKRCVIV